MPSGNITTSGNLISDDFIELLREPEYRHEALRPDAFAPASGSRPRSLDEDLAAGYELLRDRWEAVRTEIAEYDLPTLRSRWVVPLLQALDYDPTYLRSNIEFGSGRDAVKLLPWVHTVIANAKGNIRGVYHGVSSKHLGRYLAEFSYRFNRRFWESQMFDRMLTACLATNTIGYSELRE